MKTLTDIETVVRNMASKIGAEDFRLPGFGSARDDEGPFITIADGQYHYVIEERGQETGRQSSAEPDDVLYWAFADITHGMAFAWELTHRIPAQDCRRQGFAKQLALLAQLQPAMAERRRAELDAILQTAPYVDG